MSTEQQAYCQQDPFAFVADLLDTSALSWMIFLSQARHMLGVHQFSISGHGLQLERLQSNKVVFDRAYRYFSDTIAFLYDRESKFIARCSNSENLQQMDKVANRILKDFNFLQREAEDLSRESREAINILMSSISVRESQKGLADARRIQVVTYLAFIFIPLSFVSSLFGMNVQEFSEPAPGTWLFFSVAVPLTMGSLVLPIWLEFHEGIRCFWAWFYDSLGLWRLFGLAS